MNPQDTQFAPVDTTTTNPLPVRPLEIHVEQALNGYIISINWVRSIAPDKDSAIALISATLK